MVDGFRDGAERQRRKASGGSRTSLNKENETRRMSHGVERLFVVASLVLVRLPEADLSLDSFYLDLSVFVSSVECQVWPTLAESVNVTKAAVAPSMQGVTVFTFRFCIEHCPVQGQAKASAPKRAQRKAQSMCKFQCFEKCSVWRRQLCRGPG